MHVCFLYHGIDFCDGDVFFFSLISSLNVMFLFRIYSSVRSTPRWILTLTSWRSNLIPDIQHTARVQTGPPLLGAEDSTAEQNHPQYSSIEYIVVQKKGRADFLPIGDIHNSFQSNLTPGVTLIYINKKSVNDSNPKRIAPSHIQ